MGIASLNPSYALFLFLGLRRELSDDLKPLFRELLKVRLRIEDLMGNDVYHEVSQAVELVRRYNPERLLRFRVLGCGWVLFLPLFLLSLVFAFAHPWPGIVVAAIFFIPFVACLVGSERIRLAARKQEDYERNSNRDILHRIHREVDALRSQLNEQYESSANLPDAEIDFFISHASEDKDSFVRLLANRLKELDCSVFYDEYTLKVGDSLRRSIEQGLRSAKFGIVVLSRNFFRKQWPAHELDALFTLEIAGRLRILPIWHEVTSKDVMNFSPLLADKVALNTSNSSLNDIADDLVSLLRR